MTVNQTPIIWFTGMSGSGKSTLSACVKQELTEQGLTVCIIDGDTVRESYQQKLGFSRDEVMQNNLHIASLCQKVRLDFDVILVPVISPYQEVRRKVRKLLGPNFHLIYLKTTLDNLKKRDTKGLYALADCGVIKDLIGYSKETPYEVPGRAELVIDTSIQETISKATVSLFDYIEFHIERTSSD